MISRDVCKSQIHDEKVKALLTVNFARNHRQEKITDNNMQHFPSIDLFTFCAGYECV